MIQSSPVAAFGGRDDAVFWPLMSGDALVSITGIVRAVLICSRDGFDDVMIDSDDVPEAWDFNHQAVVRGRLVSGVRWMPGRVIAAFDEEMAGLWRCNITLFDAVHSEGLLVGSVILSISPSTVTVVNTNRQPLTGALGIIGQQPSIVIPAFMRPTTGLLTLGGNQPGLTVGNPNPTRQPSSGGLILTGNQVSRSIAGTFSISPSVAALSLSGKQASVSSGGGGVSIDMTAGTDGAGFTGYASSAITGGFPYGSLTGATTVGGYALHALFDFGDTSLGIEIGFVSSAPNGLFSSVSFTDQFGNVKTYTMADLATPPYIDGGFKFFDFNYQGSPSGFNVGDPYVVTFVL